MTFNGKRPITYVGNGGHANYATAGKQEYTIAAGIVTDTVSNSWRDSLLDLATFEISPLKGIHILKCAEMAFQMMIADPKCCRPTRAHHGT